MAEPQLPNPGLTIEHLGTDAIRVTVPYASKRGIGDSVNSYHEGIAGPETVQALGFRAEKGVGEVSIVEPSTPKLNEKIHGIGNTDRKYVDYEGGVVPGIAYLTGIAKEVTETPLSTQPELRLHDTISHTGWALLPKRAMNI